MIGVARQAELPAINGSAASVLTKIVPVLFDGSNVRPPLENESGEANGTLKKFSLAPMGADSVKKPVMLQKGVQVAAVTVPVYVSNVGPV
jgi:hypothetical protein